MKPRRRIAARTTSASSNARTRIPLWSEVAADRVLLAALDRNGVDGVAGLQCLTAVNALSQVIREAGGLGYLDLRLVPGVAKVRIQLDVTDHLASLAEWLLRPADFPAPRWGTLHEHHRTTLWAEIDRTGLSTVSFTDAGLPIDTSEHTGRSDPVELLVDVTARLAGAKSLGEVAEVIGGPLRAHLGADTADVAVRDGSTVRLVSTDHPSGSRAGPTMTRSTHTRAAIQGPIAATARDGGFRGYVTAGELDQEFPGAGSRSRANHTQALAAVPLTVASQPIGALAVGWRGAQPIDELRPLLTIVAKHTADATIRATSPPPDVRAMVGDGPRAPGATATRTEQAGGVLQLDVVSRTATVAGRNGPVRLTGREFELLHFLVQHSGTIQSRQDTLREVWGIDFNADTSVIDVTISRLRRKLGTDAIITVRDQGYMLRT